VNIIDCVSLKENSISEMRVDLEKHRDTELEEEAINLASEEIGVPKSELETLLVEQEDFSEYLEYKVDTLIFHPWFGLLSSLFIL
jgi:Fe2+ transport system protein B